VPKLPQLLLQWRILQVPIAHPTTFGFFFPPPPKSKSKANAGPNILYPSPALCTHTAITPDSGLQTFQEHTQHFF
jgi:hypothetical protein